MSTLIESQNLLNASQKVKPIVAILGRPNVGKSTLINRILGSRKAIVDDQPGVTRDRCYYDAEWCGKTFTVVDTGGMDPTPEGPFGSLVNEQVAVTVKEADVVVLVMDGQMGLTALDEAVATFIRQHKKPVVLAVNKIDRFEDNVLTAEFYKLGLGDPIGLSAMHGSGGVGDLLDAVAEHFPDDTLTVDEDAETGPTRIAIVGRPNVGKSSIVNALLGHERTIVSSISGTTRDAIDVPVTFDDEDFVLIDTAGIRRKSKVDYGVEMFSVDRAIRAINNSDVVVIVLDASGMADEKPTEQMLDKPFELTDQEKKIFTTAYEAGKGIFFVVNKWDAIPNKDANATEKFRKSLVKSSPFTVYFPFVFTSATEKHSKGGQRLTKIFKLAQQVAENNQRRIQTSVLNEVMTEALVATPPPTMKSRQLKVYYATQATTAPPTFVLFVNNPKLMKPTYERYLEKRLRESFELTGTPIRFILREKVDKRLKK